MKAILPLSAALVASSLAASPVAKSLAGVSDKETAIPYREIRNSVRGHGDVFFVQDRANQWYRLQVNEGCARDTSDANGLIFRHRGPSHQIDRFTSIFISGAMRSCAIRSIRKSQPPPQIDSKSPVTLD
jgi:hypothetical protein